LLQGGNVNRVTVVNFFAIVKQLDIYCHYVLSVAAGEPSFGQTPVQGHLAAFKADFAATARTCALSFVSATGCFSVA
jgi:hypothetical protein